jgi:NADPH-dependent glutamate synthase beta subunit-like oxidoreductase
MIHTMDLYNPRSVEQGVASQEMLKQAKGKRFLVVGGGLSSAHMAKKLIELEASKVRKVTYARRG